MELKKGIFWQVEFDTDDARFGSNRSSLSVTELEDVTDHPGHVVGMHFFIPTGKVDTVKVFTVRKQPMRPQRQQDESWLDSMKKQYVGTLTYGDPS